jgi:hypothetical protein
MGMQERQQSRPDANGTSKKTLSHAKTGRQIHIHTRTHSYRCVYRCSHPHTHTQLPVLPYGFDALEPHIDGTNFQKSTPSYTYYIKPL